MTGAAIWIICALTLGAVFLRPRGIPDWCSAGCGAAVLVAARLLPGDAAARAVWDGAEVYLFLAGMLALAELARAEGLFDWIAAQVVPTASGSQGRLFAWTFLVGTAVTALLSNDATILLLTPAVLAAVRAAGADPLPYAYLCAFVANAASFVLPISNPANLVLFRGLPSLPAWLAAFALPSMAALAVTFWLTRGLFSRRLAEPCGRDAGIPALGPGAKLAAALVLLSAGLIVAAASLGWPVGLCAFLCGAASLIAVAVADTGSTRAVLRGAPWSIIPFVAALFVMIEALDRTGILETARAFLRHASSMNDAGGNLLAGAATTLAANLLNNLPAGVIARHAVSDPHLRAHIAHAVLVGIDLGPNVSVTGSLATILWLAALRRENIEVRALDFLRIGACVTIPALALALLAVR